MPVKKKTADKRMDYGNHFATSVSHPLAWKVPFVDVNQLLFL